MKTLLSNKTDFDDFLSIHTGHDTFHGNVVSYIDEPEKYPCVLVYEMKVDNDGPDYIDGEFAYNDDFEVLKN